MKHVWSTGRLLKNSNILQVRKGKTLTTIVKLQNLKEFLDIKNVKITKRFHAYKGYGSTCKVEILNSFNVELEVQDTESAIKIN